jgi:hypothetical protein
MKKLLLAAAALLVAAAALAIDLTPPLTITGGTMTGTTILTPVYSIPVVTTATSYTALASDQTVVFNAAGTATITLLSAQANGGKRIRLQTIAAFTVVSPTSNVIPCAGGAAGTAILAATAGKWADLESDAANWRITACN